MERKHGKATAGRSKKAVKTTLYNLIDAIGAELAPGEESFLEMTLAHMLKTGSVKFLGKSGNFPSG